MNKKQHYFTGSLAALALLSASSLSAATLIQATTGAAGLTDTQGPAASGSLYSISTDADGSNFAGTGPADAISSVNDTGRAAVSASGIFACGSCTYDLSASSYYETSYTNTFANSVDFTFNFSITGPTVEVIDYGYVNQASGLGAEANASVVMNTTGGLSDSQTMSIQLLGGDAGHDVTYNGGTATLFTTGGGFGYEMGNVSGSFSGTLAAGESVTISSELFAAAYGPGFEVGSSAFFGDPNNLDTAAGISSEFIVSAVPVPAAVWLFTSGLIGLTGVSMRKKA